MRPQLATLLLVLGSMAGCKKDEQPGPAVNGGVPWMEYVAVSSDTAFIMAPNVITPNADGINDQFLVIGRHVSSMQCTVLDAAGEVAFSSQSLQPVWSDVDATDSGTYRVFVSATTFSGVPLTAQSYLYVMVYDANLCLPFTGTPVTSDQLDPRILGVTYTTNDIFCP